MKINLELVMCAQANFENFQKSMPAQIMTHPYWLIAKAQLDEALGGKTVEESLKPYIKTTEIHFQNGKATILGEDNLGIAGVIDGETGKDILERPGK